MKRDQFIFQIAAMHPAPGWRVVCCFIDAKDRPNYYEVPVIGWAVLRPVPLSGELSRDCEDALELYVFDEYPGTISDQESLNSTYRVNAPGGKELGSDGRAEMEAEIRRKMGQHISRSQVATQKAKPN
jgi:hypothetical protein